MEYTVLGRHVELAEELARKARDAVLVGARTRALCEGIAFEERAEPSSPCRAARRLPRAGAVV